MSGARFDGQARATLAWQIVDITDFVTFRSQPGTVSL
jgi:hypothetical protein